MVHELRLSDASTAEAWSGWTLNATDNAGRVLFSIPLVEEAAGRARKTGSGIRPRRVHGSDVARLPAQRQR
jgi:hypothetical protein